jgi:N6-adenosine-specific RNA methylase IME4
MYRGMLTWVKPSLGLGNYFRGTTEHVLFGIRGKLKLRSTHIALPSCQYRRRRSTGSRSILRPPRRLASTYPRHCSPAPTR